VIRSKEEYWYSVGSASLLFGKVKIWGEVVEHEAGYRSQFGRIVSLDYGDPELLEKFRKIYRVNQVPAEPSASKPSLKLSMIPEESSWFGSMLQR